MRTGADGGGFTHRESLPPDVFDLPEELGGQSTVADLCEEMGESQGAIEYALNQLEAEMKVRTFRESINWEVIANE